MLKKVPLLMLFAACSFDPSNESGDPSVPDESTPAVTPSQSEPGQAAAIVMPTRTEPPSIKVEPVVAPAKAPATSTAPIVRIKVADYYTADAMPVTDGSFAMWTTPSLVLYFYFEGLNGQHSARVEIVDPERGKYSVETLAFDTDVNHPYEAKIDGIGPTTVWPTYETSRGERVETVLPISGTAITNYVLAGEWNVRLYLDGHSAPSAIESFELLDEE